MNGITAVALATGVLLGSMPVAWILVRWTSRRDLSRSGSGNVGALNAMRVARSRSVGVAVLALDLLKGAGAVWIAQALGGEPGAGVVGAVAGHCYNPWLSLRAGRLAGGKGFATAAGGLLALHPWLVPLWLVVGVVAWGALRVMRGITDEAPASAVATLAVVPAAAWLYDARAAVVTGVAAALILPKLAREVRDLVFRRTRT